VPRPFRNMKIPEVAERRCVACMESRATRRYSRTKSLRRGTALAEARSTSVNVPPARTNRVPAPP